MVIGLIIAASAVGILLILLILAALCNAVAFGKRCDKNPLLKYYTAENFNLSVLNVSFKVGKNTVRGGIYRGKNVESNKKFIIFCHGMGAGHIAYTTEIAAFCNRGYTVLGFDYVGCNMSDGKNIRGMYAGAIAVKQAISFVKKSEKFKDMPLYLVGHSWGGYSALCASYEIKVDKAVAISAPCTPAKTVCGGAKRFIGGFLAGILTPFCYVINVFKFGFKGNRSAAKCAKNNGTPTLLIHGGKDLIVANGNAAYYKTYGENVEKYFAEDKAHNPYNTVNAEKLLSDLSAQLFAFKKTRDREYFSSFDYAAATEEDGVVMEKIFAFLER